MSDPLDDQSQPRESVTNVSGGITASPEGDLTIDGDTVGRDKAISAQTYIEKVEITYRPDDAG